jgi:DNA-binding beta-propeller fold protein YncE
VLFDRVIDSDGGLGELAIDSAARKLYGVGTKVIDIDNWAIVDSMPAALGHGYAFATDLGRGISRRGAIFDTRTHILLKPGAEHSASTVAYDMETKLAALTYNPLQIVDVASARLASVVQIGESDYVIADNSGHFYASLASDTVVVIDAKRAVVTGRWGLGSCHSTAGMAIDRLNQRLFVSCDNRRLIVLDYTTGRIVAELATRVGEQIVFDPSKHLLFIPTVKDTVTVVKEDNPETFRVLGGIAVGPIHPAIALDLRSQTLFLVHFGRSASDSTAIVLMALAPNAKR